jgi:hypothetical protein
MRLSNLTIVISLVLGVVSCFNGNAADTPVILGMVEERTIDEFDQTTRKVVTTYETSLRIVFQKNDTGWTPVCPSKPEYSRPQDCHFSNPENERTWDVIYRGRIVGQVKTSGWRNGRFYKNAGLLRIVSEPVPRVGSRSKEFAGWVDRDVYRPLVALISPAKAKSDRWKEVPSTRGDLNTVWPPFAKIIKEIPNCEFAEPGRPTGKPAPLKSQNVEVFRVLVSGRGDRLIGARVKATNEDKYSGCGGFTSDLWFFSRKKSTVLPLVAGSLKGWRFAFAPIDFGDFDGNASPEGLFWFSGYNEDGYVLFTENFQKSVRFAWLYH